MFESVTMIRKQNVDINSTKFTNIEASRITAHANLSCFHLFDCCNSNIWNNIVTSFKQYDVYYLNNYVKAFRAHGDGEPYLLYYETDELRGFNVVMKRDIAQLAPYNKILAPQTYFDLTTPYGYGGFIFEGDVSTFALKTFYTKYAEFIKSQNIISEFVRYHPLLHNANTMQTVSLVTALGNTIAIDLETKEKIWFNFTCSNRNQIRKAEKMGIEIHHGKGLELLDTFRKIYNSTMDKDKADQYYYFEKAFYESIHNDLYDHYEVFYAVFEEQIIAVSIIIFANNLMHCHLLGSIFEYRSFAPSHLLIYKAACWGLDHGYKTLHLGGGLGAEKDNLFHFKKSFNRNSCNVFSIGKKIFNQEVYDQLVNLRIKNDSKFDCNSSFFPLYRA